jgi:DNA polymerase-3 subunit alpha
MEWADEKELPLLLSEMQQCSEAKIAPPEVNISGSQFFTNCKTNEIFWSLSRIKVIGTKTVDFIVGERTRTGDYHSVEDFIQRIFKHKNVEDVSRIPVNARHVKNLILSGCFDRVERISDITGRYGILKRAAQILCFNLLEEDFPKDLILLPHFWQMQQISIAGTGEVDYRRIYDNSPVRKQIRWHK